jgi:hypothetical protein
MSAVDEAFDKLCTEFTIDPKIRAWLTDTAGLGCKNMADFQFAGASVGAAEAMVKVCEIKEPAQQMLQVSRIKQAIASLETAARTAELLKKGIDETDLDSLLTQPELDTMENSFWTRYKQQFPAWVRPADLLISRLSRELSKRMLSVRDVWKTKTLSFQQTSSRKRAKVGDSIEVITSIPEEEEMVEQNLGTYMSLLYTLLLAYAFAGIKGVGNGGAQEPRGSRTTTFVQVPWDVLLQYFYRVQEKAKAVPAHKALEWVSTRDLAERTAWVDRFRNGNKTLGQVVEEVLDMREAMWEYVREVATPQRQQRQEDRRDESPRKNRRQAKKGGGKGGDNGDGRAQKQGGARRPNVVKLQLKNGTKLCPAFQRGQCKEGAQCQKGKHMCGAEEKGGRICGAPHSPANGGCNNNRVVRA